MWELYRAPGFEWLYGTGEKKILESVFSIVLVSSAWNISRREKERSLRVLYVSACLTQSYSHLNSVSCLMLPVNQGNYFFHYLSATSHFKGEGRWNSKCSSGRGASKQGTITSSD